MPTTPTRRSNGEGSTPYQRGDGRWQINLRIPAHQTTTGQSIRKAFIGKTRADVVAKVRAARTQLQAGVLTDPNQLTLEVWLTHWLEAIAKPRLKATTHQKYVDTLGRWVIGSREGKIPLERLTPTHVEQVYARMRDAGRAESTILGVHRNLSKALTDAVARGHLGANPARKVAAPKPGAFEPVVLDAATVRTLLRDAARDEQWGPGWTVALALGLRQGERLGLCWEDVDLKAGTLQVRRELGTLRWRHGEHCSCAQGAPARTCPDRAGGGYVMLPVKSARGRRVWALPAPVAAELARQRELQEQWRVEAGEAWTGFTDWEGRSWDLVFSTWTGGPINNKADRRAWKAFTEEHGIRDMRVHDARHTAATSLLSMNVAPRVVMDLMGWSQMGMLTRYQHLLDDLRVATAGQMEGALWGGEEPPPDPGPESAAVVDLQAFRARRRA